MKVLPIARLEEGQQPIAGENDVEEIYIKAVAPSSDGKDLVVVILAKAYRG
jgi:hypothetical protein